MTDDFETALRRAANRIADSGAPPEDGLNRALTIGSRRRAIKAGAVTGLGSVAILAVGAALALSVFSQSSELDPQVATDIIGARDVVAPTAAVEDVDDPAVAGQAQEEPAQEEEASSDADDAPVAPELEVTTDTQPAETEQAAAPPETEASANDPAPEPRAESSATKGPATTTNPAFTSGGTGSSDDPASGSDSTASGSDSTARPVVGEDPLSNPPPPRPTAVVTQKQQPPAAPAAPADDPEPTAAAPTPPAEASAATSAPPAEASAATEEPAPTESPEPVFSTPAQPDPVETDEPVVSDPAMLDSAPEPTATSVVPTATPVPDAAINLSPLPTTSPVPPPLDPIPGSTLQCRSHNSTIPDASCGANTDCVSVEVDCNAPVCVLPSGDVSTKCAYVPEYPCPSQSDVVPGYTPQRSPDGSSVCVADAPAS